MMCFRKGLGLSSITGALLFAASPSVLAQVTDVEASETGVVVDDEARRLDRVTVTATKTGEQDLQNVPIAITAYSGEELIEAGALDVEAVVAQTPNVTFGSNLGAAIVSIRGIGTNNVFAGGDPSVSIQVDGVYYGRPTGGNLDFADVERVEVLRGPQGTLYGRNATGGTINVVTKTPGSEPEFDLRATIGDFNARRIDAFAALPLVEDKLAVSVAGRISERDGFFTNLVDGVEDTGSEDRASFRGKLLFTPNEDLSVTLSADFAEANDEQLSGYTARIFVPPFFDDGFSPGLQQSATDAPGTFDLEQSGLSAKVEWDVTDNVTLTSITAVRESKSNALTDSDSLAIPLLATTFGLESQEQFSQEVNLNGVSGDLNWVAGLYYFEEDARNQFVGFSQVPPFPGALGFITSPGVDVSTESIAAFAQGTYRLTDRLSVTAGLRWTEDKKDAANSLGFEPLFLPEQLASFQPSQLPAGFFVTPRTEIDESAVTPKFGIEYQHNEDLLVFASATKGFKSGGFNSVLQAGTTTAPYDPETLWSYEAGLKSIWMNDRITTNVAGFFYDYQDLQINQLISVGNDVQTLISNAPEAEIYGLEVEVDALLAEGFRAGFNLALLDGEYTESFSVPDAATNATVDAAGNTLNDAPETSGLVYGQFENRIGAWGLTVRAEAQYKDDVFYSPANTALEQQDGYWLANASLLLESPDERWQVGVVGRNIFDEEYLTNTASIFGIIVGRPGNPSTVSGYVRYRF